MRIAIVVLVVGCGATPRSAPSVRLARDNEFPAQLRYDDRGLPRWAYCDPEGVPDRALYQPLLAYERDKLERSRSRPSGLDVHWEGEPYNTRLHSDFVRIDI